MKKKLIFIGVGLCVLIVLLLSLYIYNISTRNVIEQLTASRKTINILIAGSNVYRDDKHRLYAIMSINPDNSRIGFTFIPPAFRIHSGRDSGTAYRIDEMEIGDFKRISEFFYREYKIQIPFYIELYASDVRRIVDLIEGIDVYILDQATDLHNWKVGINYLDGEKVIQYINSSQENSIFKKYDRIQDILLTLYHNKNRYVRFRNITFIEEILRTVRTNLLSQEILSLAELIFQNSLAFCTIIPGKFSDDGFYCTDTIDSKIYEKELLRKLIVDEDTDSVIKVKILNGTNVPGLARRMRNMLIKDGLSVVEFGTSPFPPNEHTIIINQKGNTDDVLKVAALIETDRIYHAIDTTQLHSVLIIIGGDFVR